MRPKKKKMTKTKSEVAISSTTPSRTPAMFMCPSCTRPISIMMELTFYGNKRFKKLSNVEDSMKRMGLIK